MISDYRHHVPGRLRVRAARVKADPAAAHAARALVASLCGVRWVEANTLTGSLTVYYDVALTSGDAVLGFLHSQGYIRDRSVPKRDTRPARAPNGELAARLAYGVATALAEKALERTIAIAISAVL